ncbi:carbohydrate ABC transporter permease [Paenibacillus sp. PAMC21692]|uniref:carbohydrate ABC transporter permease n=1 Tax=Paenibacillus sp. PAMC21692 TaxID=2762320 RepID=UPI00164D1F56|nr:carbohydrate ABC transporter permease [Paenibacillus sp. PAMC21692]QNK57912.1 carbohydrate ABC transporter permease [Paenibacillus sp. PAMC21692]
MKIKQSLGEKTFDIGNILFLALMCIIVLIPLLHIIAGSFSSTNALIHSQVKLWPVEFNFDNYGQVLNNSFFWNSFRVTIFITVVGTIINLLLTVLMAYPLSKSGLRGRKIVVLIIVFTMIFSAPLIPTYLVVKSLGLINTLWALIIPSAISMFNVILCLTFFKSLPEELFEAARVDGMSEYGILFKIVVPLSVPILVTLTLYYAVHHWNSYFSAMIYITKPDLRPLQLYLYSMIAQGNTNDVSSNIMEELDTSPEGLKMATIIVATVPIMFIYPFIQKHFIKGTMLGSLKE